MDRLLWQHDNARPHIKQCVQQFIEYRNIELLHQSAYSPDLNLCDRWLNCLIKDSLREELFDNAEQVEERIVDIMRNIDVQCYRNEVDKLIQHCTKVIECGGGYVTPS